MAITIKELANLAGVSRGSVDKALNNRPGISDETREKILKIAKAADYRPNIIGQVLVNSGTTIRIGVLLTSQDNSFIKMVMQGIQAVESEFSTFNFEVIVKNSMTIEPEEYCWLIDELVAENISGVAILPVEDAMFVERVNKIRQQGIEVVTFNSFVEGVNHLCYVGQDHYKGGRTAGGLMGKMLPNGGGVGVIISTKHLSCHKDRLRGFQDKLCEQEIPVEILEVLENRDMRETALRQTVELCNRYPNLKGIYITGGGVAGAARALEMCGLAKEVTLICHDVLPDIWDYMRDGTIDFALDQDGFQQGYRSVKLLCEKLLKGIVPKDKVLWIPVSIATGDSI